MHTPSNALRFEKEKAKWHSCSLCPESCKPGAVNTFCNNCLDRYFQKPSLSGCEFCKHVLLSTGTGSIPREPLGRVMMWNRYTWDSSGDFLNPQHAVRQQNRASDFGKHLMEPENPHDLRGSGRCITGNTWIDVHLPVHCSCNLIELLDHSGKPTSLIRPNLHTSIQMHHMKAQLT